MGYFEQALLAESELSNADDLDALNRHWFDYALSTTARGEELVGTIRALAGDLTGARWLDVGSGYGGLAIAAANAGAIVTGVEYDSRLLKLATENLRDFPSAAVTLLHGDITDSGLLLSRNDWDIVTLDNVIEHVRHPQQVFQRLTELLGPKGIAYISAPNGRSFNQISSDCHYQQFAISLLDPARGADYLRVTHPDLEYDVSWLHRRGVYQQIAELFGLQARLINGTQDSVLTRQQLAAGVAQIRAGSSAAVLPEVVRGQVATLVEEIATDVDAALRLADSIDPIRRIRLLAELQREHLDEVWYWVVSWPPATPAIGGGLASRAIDVLKTSRRRLLTAARSARRGLGRG